jgi:hypothetical protein
MPTASPAAPQTLAPGAAVPKWSVVELPLTADGDYATPYLEAGVRATFRGPGGEERTANGFWDGGATWKVRFTPTAEGPWTYTTASADTGLDARRGTFQCVAPLPGSRGFLRRDEDHRQHFVWDDGARYFMFGTTYYQLLANALAGDRWRAAIDGALGKGINKVRLNHYQVGG